MSPSAIVEMLLRFYGAGAKRDFSNVLGVFVQRPYDIVREHLRRASGIDLEDITDPNDEVSFGFAFDGYVLRLSMVGPFALLLIHEVEVGRWIPVERAASEVEQAVIDYVRAHGFLLLTGDDMECSVELWGEEPSTSLYHLLFVSEGEVPWKGLP